MWGNSQSDWHRVGSAFIPVASQEEQEGKQSSIYPIVLSQSLGAYICTNVLHDFKRSVNVKALVVLVGVSNEILVSIINIGLHRVIE